MMKQSSDEDGDSDSKEDFAKKMGEASLSVDQMQTYAGADSVKDFYYTLTSSVNADGIEAVESSSSVMNQQIESSSEQSETAKETTESSAQDIPQMQGGQGGDMQGGPMMGTQGSFTLIGYSSDSAMTDFVSGTKSLPGRFSMKTLMKRSALFQKNLPSTILLK
jgi:putative ABC transport system permease protein